MACDLDGANDFLSIPFNSDYEFPGDFAINFKINFDSLTGVNNKGGVVLGRGANSNFATGGGANAVVSVWWLRVESSTISLARYDGIDANYVEYVRSFNFLTSTPYTITATRLGTSFTFYVNGAPVGSSFTTSLQFTQFSGGAPQDLIIGKTLTGDPSGILEGPNFAHYLNSQISEVAIWKGAGLTAADATALTAGFTADQIRPQNLVLYAPLVRQFQDVRGGRAITNNGGATVATHPRVIT